MMVAGSQWSWQPLKWRHPSRGSRPRARDADDRSSLSTPMCGLFSNFFLGPGTRCGSSSTDLSSWPTRQQYGFADQACWSAALAAAPFWSRHSTTTNACPSTASSTNKRSPLPGDPGRLRKQRQKTEETFYFAPNDEEDLELEEEEEVEDDDDEEYTAPTAASRPKVRTKRPGQGTNVRGGRPCSSSIGNQCNEPSV